MGGVAEGAVAGHSPVIVLLIGGSGSRATPALRQLCRAKVGGDVLLSIGDPDLRPG